MAKKKKAIEPFDHWQPLVEVFFQFCRDNFAGVSPSFDGSAPRDMKVILTQIRKRAEEKNVGWTLQEATSRWKAFLSLAFKDNWLKEHWTLANLNRQKDALFLKAAITHKPSRPSSVSTTELPEQTVYDLIN